MSDVAFFGDFLMGDRERLVLSRDFRLGDLLRGITPSIAVSKFRCFAGDRRLGERRRVVSSIPDAMISYKLRYREAQIEREIYYSTTFASGGILLGTCRREKMVTELLTTLECRLMQQRPHSTSAKHIQIYIPRVSDAIT